MADRLSAAAAATRVLYDERFVREFACNATAATGILGPEGEPYDPVLFRVDDTVGTWSTNYAIAVVGILGGLWILLRHRCTGCCCPMGRRRGRIDNSQEDSYNGTTNDRSPKRASREQIAPEDDSMPSSSVPFGPVPNDGHHKEHEQDDDDEEESEDDDIDSQKEGDFDSDDEESEVLETGHGTLSTTFHGEVIGTNDLEDSDPGKKTKKKKKRPRYRYSGQRHRAKRLAIERAIGERQDVWWVVVYYWFTGIGYGIAGVGHQVISTTEENDAGWVLASLACAGLGLWGLLVHAGRRVVQRRQPPTASRRRTARSCRRVGGVSLMVFGVCFVVGAALDSPVVIGAYLLAALLLAGLSLGCLLQDPLPAAGCALYLAGIGVQIGLSGVCGDEGYDDCFASCPLPDPLAFNHNALFHVLVATGLLLQLFGRYHD